MVDWEVYLHLIKDNVKQKTVFHFLVMWSVRLITYCGPVYHSQPLEQLWLLQYSKLQMAKTVDEIAFVRVYNTYIPHDSQLCMSKK